MPKTKRKARTAAIQRTRRAIVGESSSTGASDTGGNCDEFDASQFLLNQAALLDLSDDDLRKGKELAKSLQELFKETVTGPKEKEFDVYSKGVAKYFRNKFKFFGVKAPLKRSLQKKWLESCQEALTDQGILMSTLNHLWSLEEREMQSCGCDIANQYRQTLTGISENDFMLGIQCIKGLLTNKSWWDTVDALSYQVIGYMVYQRPELGAPVMDEWISHDYMWLRRTAILHQLTRKQDTNKEQLFQYCLSCKHEDEFFIRKAIGWALRDYARFNPKDVKDFVLQNKATLSTLSVKEAMKHIS